MKLDADESATEAEGGDAGGRAPAKRIDDEVVFLRREEHELLEDGFRLLVRVPALRRIEADARARIGPHIAEASVRRQVRVLRLLLRRLGALVRETLRAG